jgi:hypothetical protein
MPSAPDPSHQGGHERFPCGPEVRATVTVGVQGAGLPAEVRTVSRAEAGLVVGRRVGLGQGVLIELRNTTTGFTLRAAGRVAHAFELGTGGDTLLDCAFDKELGAEEVERLLGRAGGKLPAWWDLGTPADEARLRTRFGLLWDRLARREEGPSRRVPISRLELILVFALVLFGFIAVFLAIYTGWADRLWRK